MQARPSKAGQRRAQTECNTGRQQVVRTRRRLQHTQANSQCHGNIQRTLLELVCVRITLAVDAGAHVALRARRHEGHAGRTRGPAIPQRKITVAASSASLPQSYFTRTRRPGTADVNPLASTTGEPPHQPCGDVDGWRWEEKKENECFARNLERKHDQPSGVHYCHRHLLRAPGKRCGAAATSPHWPLHRSLSEQVHVNVAPLCRSRLAGSERSRARRER